MITSFPSPVLQVLDVFGSKSQTFQQAIYGFRLELDLVWQRGIAGTIFVLVKPESPLREPFLKAFTHCYDPLSIFSSASAHQVCSATQGSRSSLVA